MKAFWLIAALAAASSTQAGPQQTTADTPPPPPAGEAAAQADTDTAQADSPPQQEQQVARAADANAAEDSSDTTPAAAAPPPRYDLRTAHAPPGDAQAGKAKAEVCGASHGTDGIATAPIFPNLAGQRAAYLYWSLQAYKTGRMPESPMTGMAAPLEEQDIRDLAAYYASLPVPPPAADAAPEELDASLLGQGQDIYMNGAPDKGIPPCQGCHGADARGSAQAAFSDRSGRTPYAAYPRLRGQHNDYLQTRLQQFHENSLDASTNSRVMHGIAERLDEDSIKAVSTWLSSLKE